MNIKQKITSAIAIGTMMAAVVAPASFAATTVKIHNNGALSKNGAAVVKVSKSKVKQSNTTVVGTKIKTVQKTGGNSSSFNVGGDNTITTGNNTATTTVAVTGGTNTNTAENCCCDGEGDTTVNIHDNGALSHNGALVIESCKNVVSQSNTTVVGTSVTTVQNTGGNDSSFNVGGTNGTDSGDNTATTTVAVGGSTNTN